jgi:pimeloyl-ACP methyl ester carboxylesterase
VAVYRTLLMRELWPLMAGRYADQVLAVPTTLLVGAKDTVTAALKPGPVDGQPALTVQVVEGVGHFLPEEDPAAVIAAVSRA